MAVEPMSFKDFAESKGLVLQEQHTFNKLIAYGTLIVACTSIIEMFQNILVQQISMGAILVLIVLILWAVVKQAYEYNHLKRWYNKNLPHRIVMSDY
ncbi:MAG: hypothetical protein RL557_901 [archaeon]|jgi:hypothetical protein